MEFSKENPYKEVGEGFGAHFGKEYKRPSNWGYSLIGLAFILAAAVTLGGEWYQGLIIAIMSVWTVFSGPFFIYMGWRKLKRNAERWHANYGKK
jgi:uncharacterized membrane protein